MSCAGLVAKTGLGNAEQVPCSPHFLVGVLTDDEADGDEFDIHEADLSSSEGVWWPN